jgi:hypothetical protein
MLPFQMHTIRTLATVTLATLLVLPACSGGDTAAPAPSYTLGGTVAGLSGSGLVLQNNGGNRLAVAAGAVTFVFPGSLNSGAAYNVSVAAQPTSPGQTCSVANASGTVTGDVSTVLVSCLTPPQVELTSSTSTAIQGDSVRLMWASTTANACEAFGDWAGSKPLTGQSALILATYGRLVFGVRCTGPGGATATSVTVVSRVAVRNTSYANFKEVGVVPTTLPNNEGSRAYGDFFEDGSLSLFTVSDGVYEFWTRLSNGTWSPRPNVATPIVEPSCARKGVVADFNEDRKPDILLICSGLDAPPFPGARNRILLSVPGGGYRLGDVGPEVSFHHGGAACDLNGDGHVDYVSTGSPDRPRNPLLVYFGDGHGGFTLVPNHPLSVVENAFSIECLDVNEDGLLDIVSGGHEQDGTVTSVLYGTPSGTFIRQVIPAVAKEGTVLDFTVTGTGVHRTLWVGRTSGEPGGAGTSFYEGRVLQRVDLQTLESTLVVNDAARWVVWFIPYSRSGTDYIGGDRLQDAIEVIRTP